MPRVAALSFVAVLSVVAGGGSPAIAEDERQDKSPLLAQHATITFNIPAQNLGTALTAFGRQSGIQVLVDSASVSGKTSAPVSGAMTAGEALQQLLGGTGVPYRFTSPTAVTVGSGGPAASDALQLDPVQVQGYPVPAQAMIDNAPPPYAGGQVATGGQLGLLGNRSVMDTPFNQTSYTAKKAKDQQAKTVVDVLIDDPSVRITRAENSPGGDNISIRGFNVPSSSWSYGGLYGILPAYTQSVEMADRIEVLKGPSVLLNGMPPGGSIGGTVNIVPKRAPEDGLNQVTAKYLSAAQFGGAVDVGRRFGADKEFGVRFNGVFNAGQTDVKYSADQRALAVLGLDYRGNSVRVSADLGFQSQYTSGVTPYLSLGAGVQLPYAPNARNNPTAQPWGFVARKDAFAVGRVEVDIEENVTAYVNVGVHDFRAAGVYSAITRITNFDGTAVGNNPFSMSIYQQYFTADGGIRAAFDTGPVNHQMAVTATTYTQQNGSGLSLGSGAYATNIYNPTVLAQPSIVAPASPLGSTQSLSSFGLADTLSALNNRIQLTVGGRIQQVTSANYNVSGAQTQSYSQDAFSPALAFVVKPLENVSIYGNYIQGLQQGTVVAPPFANAGTAFPPYVSTQFEAGVKVDWGKLTTTASLFQITQPSILTNFENNTQFLGGQQVNQGLELNMFGEPVKGVRVLGGAMFLNPVLTQTQNGTFNGWIAPFSPQFTLNLSGEVDIPYVPGLTLTGRAIYTSAQYIDATTYPRRTMPNWTRFDIGARYAFENPGAKDKMLVARLDVQNLLDANYWSGSDTTATFMLLGAPRSFRLSLTADF
jgi:iron complex outermembrane receptor protein